MNSLFFGHPMSKIFVLFPFQVSGFKFQIAFLYYHVFKKQKSHKKTAAFLQSKMLKRIRYY